MVHREMHTYHMTPRCWGIVWGYRGIQPWADELDDLEWTDPEDGATHCRGTADDWRKVRELLAPHLRLASPDEELFAAPLREWLRRFT